jgi:hypothetical protein
VCDKGATSNEIVINERNKQNQPLSVQQEFFKFQSADKGCSLDRTCVEILPWPEIRQHNNNNNNNDALNRWCQPHHRYHAKGAGKDQAENQKQGQAAVILTVRITYDDSTYGWNYLS